MISVFARKALLADGWSDGVRLSIEGGVLAGIERGAARGGTDVDCGIVIPGVANAHSHAFQRALAGRTEQRGPEDRDNFWTWRSRMYRLAGRIDAAALTAIARQLYTEMLGAGYTSVAEFHYLHNEPGAGTPGDAMFEALVTAALDTGMRMTYVPVLYERAGFDEPRPTADQARFATTPRDFEAHYERARRRAGGLVTRLVTLGIGAHSLRAVTEAGLERVAGLAEAGGAALHIHVAEQRREVEQCIAVLGARPVEWLLRRFDVDERWCLVHATHIDAEESAAVADSGAVVCLCPSTEANLGDGLFPLAGYLSRGGRIAVGSDSHVSLNPFEELRWLEYGQRLVSESRNVAVTGVRGDGHSGRALFERAVAGGARAVGRAGGALAAGAPADFVVLDDDNPMLVGHDADSLLDALVFSGFTLPIDRVMTDGVWRVVDGRHVDRERARAEYAQTVRRLFPPGASG